MRNFNLRAKYKGNHYLIFCFHYQELQELKRQIITSIKMNKNLEQDLDMMDVKIGLLVKNRITLQVNFMCARYYLALHVLV